MTPSPGLEEGPRHAPLAPDGAAAGNIIELCRHYLAVPAECPAELYQLPDRLGIS